MEQLGWRVILGLTGGLTGLFALFVAVLFLSRGTAVESAYEVADHSQPPGATAAGAEPAEPRPTVTVRASDYGQILFDDRGYALYAFTRDPRGRSACVGACAESWPPYLLRGSVRVGAGHEAALLATTRRPNGDRQVTYAGRPLYHWVGDREPGAVGCQNVSEFGGLWLVVRADGRVVRSNR
jgi:predicted lipoprotein with Yx(FWY)xxD motif